MDPRERSERVAMHGDHTNARRAPRARGIRLSVKPEEVAVLRYALDHALASISEAHPEDRAQLKALIERLEKAERRAGS